MDLSGIIFDSIPYPSLPIKKTLLLNKTKLPKEYNLLNIYKNNLYPVYRQYVCGSCWAWSVAAILSDRYMIKYETKNPVFSPTSIISGIYCKMKNSPDIDLYNACEGGSAFDALVLLSEIMNSNKKIVCDPFKYYDLRYLLKPMECDNYDWCELNPYCNSNLTQNSNEISDHFKKDKNLNSIVPPFTIDCQKHKPADDYSKTISTKFNMKKKKYKIRLSKAYIIEDINHIKYSIYNKGPVINNFVIYPDFIHKNNSDKLYWKETDGVYIHKKGIKIYNTGENDALDNDKLLGYHSTTVVGWGVQKFNKKKLFNILKIKFEGNEDEIIEIEYWICRNIWGKDWNGNGYFKLAITQKELGINTEVGADLPVKLHINGCYMPCGTECEKGEYCSKTNFGGCCAIDILDKEEDDYTDTNVMMNRIVNNKVYKNFITMNKIPSNFSNLDKYMILDLGQKRLLNRKQKMIVKVTLILILIYLLRSNYRDCRNLIFIVLVTLLYILSNRL